MLQEYQDGVEKFIRFKGSRWLIDKGYIIRIKDERAFEEPYVALLRSLAFVPYFLEVSKIKFRNGWHDVDSFRRRVFYEALALEEFVRALGEQGDAFVGSQALAAAIGSSLAFLKCGRAKAIEFLEGYGVEVAYDGSLKVFVSTELFELTLPEFRCEEAWALLPVSDAFFDAAEEISRRSALEVVREWRLYFLAIEKALKGEEGLWVAEEGWYEVRGERARGKNFSATVPRPPLP